LSLSSASSGVLTEKAIEVPRRLFSTVNPASPARRPRSAGEASERVTLRVMLLRGF